MKYFLITFGCQMNKSDSEHIASVLEKIGYSPSLNINRADLVLVNMCSVRQSAVDRVYGKIKDFAKLKTQNSNLKTILTGCILASDKKKFKKEFDLILDIKDLPNWPKYLKLMKPYLAAKPKYSNNFSALVPISNGCNNSCSYCVVPFVRGALVCRNHKEILNEIKNVIKNGFKEIWLLGQNVNDYKSQKINFAKLLKIVNNIPGEFWIRFTSPHPADFSDQLIETMAKCQKVTPYLNLPVQSGDNEILKKMNRPYRVEDYKNLVKKIRARFAKIRSRDEQISISTDAIVGFPGETKKQFQNTAKLFKEINFDMAYIAKFSPRPQTLAFKMKNDISEREKEKRQKILTNILKKTALKNNKKYIGKEVDVLIDSQKNGFLFGKTKTYKTVKIQPIIGEKRRKIKLGKFAKVKIIGALPWGLKAKIP